MGQYFVSYLLVRMIDLMKKGLRLSCRIVGVTIHLNWVRMIDLMKKGLRLSCRIVGVTIHLNWVRMIDLMKKGLRRKHSLHKERVLTDE